MSDILNLRDKQIEKLCEGKDEDYKLLVRAYIGAIDALKEIALIHAGNNEKVNSVLTKFNKELEGYVKM